MLARPAFSSFGQLARVAAAQLPARSSIATTVISSRRLLFPHPSQSQTSTSTFSTSPPLLKKGNSPGKKGKHFKDSDSDTSEDSSSSTPSSPTTAKEAFDFDTHCDSVNTLLQKHLTKLKDDLSRLRSSATNDANFTISTLESLPVVLENDTPSTPLRDLAHVTPKPASRRHLVITIHAPEHTKKVIRAVQKAELNMQPVVEDPVNSPNVLTISVPPPTREGREKLAEQAGKLGEKVKGEVKMVRQEGMKKLKGLVKGGKGVSGVKVDEVKKEEARLEKVVKGVEEEVKKVVEGARKGILEN